MPNSRSKGYRLERQFADKLGGKRIARSGYPGPDVKTPPQILDQPITTWEIKGLAGLPKWLLNWQEQMVREGADAIAFRQDNDRWWVMFPLAKLSAETFPYEDQK
jgi:hypothetical protein